jgi:hypothetical protein
MKRIAVRLIAAAAFLAIAGAAGVFAKATFEIPFKFEAAGRKLPAGTYWIGMNDEGKVVIRREAGNLEVSVPFIERLPQPATPIATPELVFDVAGNFEPSYTEYVTDYVLSEIWFPGQDGLLIRRLKGAHKHQTINGTMPGD